MENVVSEFGFLTENKLSNMKSKSVCKLSKDLVMKYSKLICIQK